MAKAKKPFFDWTSPDRQTYIGRQLSSKSLEGISKMPLSDFMKEMVDLEKQFIAEGYTDIVIDMDYDEYNMGFEFYGTRPETDEEYAARLDEHKRMKENQKKIAKTKKESEKRLYERLKKKYERDSK